jgi:hypothetical protein
MWSNEPRSLPDWVERGYEILSTEISEGGHDGGLPRESARNELVDHGDFPNDPNDADYAIDQLLNSGWLYEVAGKLRVTDSER